MANEITLNINAKVVNGNFVDSFNLNGTTQLDQAASGADGGVVSVTTSETTISLSRLGTEGYLFLRNLDATNYIEFGPDATGMVALGKLKPGEAAVLRLKPGVTLKAQANTATCKMLVKCWED